MNGGENSEGWRAKFCKFLKCFCECFEKKEAKKSFQDLDKKERGYQKSLYNSKNFLRNYLRKILS